MCNVNKAIIIISEALRDGRPPRSSPARGPSGGRRRRRSWNLNIILDYMLSYYIISYCIVLCISTVKYVIADDSVC